MDKKLVLNRIICILLIVLIIYGMYYLHNKNKTDEEVIQISEDELNELKNWQDGDATIYSNLTYSENLRYDLYVPSNLDNTKNQPVMLFLHGGSWNSGSKEEMDYFCKLFAKAGYITATMNYSLVNENGTVTFDDMLDEIDSCLLAIKKEGEILNIKIDKATISGYSAGGHLALLYSYSRAETSPIELKFVFEESGPTDFHPDSWKQFDSNYMVNSLFQYTGVKLKTDELESDMAEEVINSISPIYYVNENTIPTVLAYGTADTLVMPIHYKKLKSVLEEYNVEYDLLEFEGSNHVLYTNTTMQDKYYTKVLEYAEMCF